MPSLAQTGGVDGHGTVPPGVDPSVSAPISVVSPFDDAAGAWSVGGVVEHVQAPLVEYQFLKPGEPTEVALLDNLFGVNLSARYALHRRLGLDLVAPIWLTSTGDPGGGGPALGDVHLWVPVGLILPDAETGTGFALSTIPFVDLPTGASDRFLGDTALNVGVMGVAGYAIGPLATTGNIGVAVGRPSGFSNQTIGGATLYGGGSVGLVPMDSLGIHLEGRVGSGLREDSQVTVAPPGAQGGGGAASPFEWLLTVRGQFGQGLWAVGGAGRGLTSGVGSARLRAYAGLGYAHDPSAGVQSVDARQPFVFHVVDAAGDGVSGASILVDGIAVGQSGPDGRVAVADLRWKRGVQVTGPHHETQSVTAPETELRELEVVLPWRPTPVVLRVQDQAGSPVSARVVATPIGSDAVEPVESTPEELALTPGTWRIEVLAECFGDQAREVVVDPSGRPPAQLEVTLLDGGQGAARVVLRLVDPEGNPVVGARVLIDGQPVGTSADGGLVEVDQVEAGSHRLQVLHENFTEMERSDLTLDEGVNAVAVALQRVPGSVKVIARGPGGGVVADAVVRFDGPRRLAPAPLGDRGERIQTLGSGTWHLFITSAEFGFQEREIFVPEDSFELIVVEVVLQPGESGDATLALRVVDPSGTPVDGAEVVLDGRSYGSTSTGGELTLSGLLPGPRTLEVGGEAFRAESATDLTLIGGLQEQVVSLRWNPGTVRVLARGVDSPVPDAVVRFMGPETLPPAPLGPMGDGMFWLEAGAWQLLLTSESGGLHQRDLDIAEDSDRLHLVEVVMRPDEGGLANLNLRVVDEEGQVVAGAEVFLDGVPLGSTTNTGGISMTGLSVGSRELEVRAPRFLSRIEPLRLLEGDLDKELVMSWSDGVTRVRVVDAAGEPVPDAILRMLGPVPVPPAPVDVHGEHVFGLSAGTWQVLAMSETRGLAQESIEIGETGDGLAEVVVTMPSDTGGMASLLVRALDDDQNPIPGAKVRIDGDAFGITGGGGALLVEGLAPGPSQLALDAPGFKDLPTLTVDLEPGSNERIVPMTFVPGSVDVTVTDSAGAPVDAQIQAVGPGDVQGISTGSDGVVTLPLRPGTWQVIASTDTLGPSRQEVTLVPGATEATRVELVISPTRVSVAGETLVIQEKVQFDFGKATLRPDSDPILAEVADTLLSRPGIIRVEVQGHADDIGGVATNQALSQQRAEAVVRALVALGVSQEILTARGYGLQRPIDTNATEEGRANNRRVAFDIVEQQDVVTP